jgi:hypothetical protein
VIEKVRDAADFRQAASFTNIDHVEISALVGLFSIRLATAKTKSLDRHFNCVDARLDYSAR